MNEDHRWQEAMVRYLAGEASAEDLAELRTALHARPQRMAELFDAAEVELDLLHPEAFADLAPAAAAAGTEAQPPATHRIEGHAADSGDHHASAGRDSRTSPFTLFRRFVMHPRTQLAAAAVALAVIGVMLLSPGTPRSLAAENIIMLPEGGRLDALDEHGQTIGPCPLEHTDVTVDISGHFTRVTAKQTYENPYDRKIEAVYTFPLSHRGAVDRMTMTVGDRVIEGEVTEREQARRIYEAAREDGYVASLLEQERPNIFTQSVANIEPGERIVIEISYVETLESVNGEYQFAFPMVVAPRYIPGQSISPTLALPDGLHRRPGVVLLGPAKIESAQGRGAERLHQLLSLATAIDPPGERWIEKHGDADRLHSFTATYATGAKETGELFADGTGHVNGRWFYVDLEEPRDGDGFAKNSSRVDDAARITPMPVRPDQRAGHDISVTVNIDTGGPGIETLAAPQHHVTQRVLAENEAGEPSRVRLTLANEADIPNRDFLLTWRQTGDTINEATFTHTGDYGDWSGGFFTLMLQPPDRVADDAVVPREIIFVLDSSGSMSSEGVQPGVSSIDAAKRVISKAIDTMRPTDRFNIISFNNTTDVLWNQPRPNTAEHRRLAQAYIDQRQGGGGTEMYNAVMRALRDDPAADAIDRPAAGLTPRQLYDEQADGRDVVLITEADEIEPGGERTHQVHIPPFDSGLRVPARVDIVEQINLDIPGALEGELAADAAKLRLHGRWVTENRERILRVHRIEPVAAEAEADAQRMRMVVFLTDGLVGNDDQIVTAVREHADKTRLFTIGMSRSPNRHVLEEMALAGRGTSDYVLPDEEVDAVVQRFVDRMATPVLTDISLTFSDGLNVHDVTPNGDRLPDLYDVEPLVLHGRYTQPGAGTLTIRGRTGAGPYERTIDLELPQDQPNHDVIATLWARTTIDQLKRKNDRDGIVAMGETFGIVSEHTSFVAVEKSRVTVGGKPMLVRVPIEFPKDMSWSGIFGGEPAEPDEELRLGTPLQRVQPPAQEVQLLYQRTVEGVPAQVDSYAARNVRHQNLSERGRDGMLRSLPPARQSNEALADRPQARAGGARGPQSGTGGGQGLFSDAQAEPSQQRAANQTPPRPYGVSRFDGGAARDDAGNGRQPLPIDLPNPVFQGTPTEIPQGVRMLPPTGQPREPFLAPAGVRNISLGKPVTASDDLPLLGDLHLVTDGDKEALDGRYVEFAPGPQWVQIDLGQPREIHAILLWLNHMEAHVYRGVIVQVSNDPRFDRGVTTLFNNDHENTIGLGAGGDFQYFESADGKLVEGNGVVARYVRVWTNGSTSSDQNHFTEVEVWGREPGEGEASVGEPSDGRAPSGKDTQQRVLEAAAQRAMQEAAMLNQRIDAKLLAQLRNVANEEQPQHRRLVTVRLSDLEPGVAQLREHGFDLEDTVERGSFVVGWLTLDDLERIALLNHVRRVELVDVPAE